MVPQRSCCSHHLTGSGHLYYPHLPLRLLAPVFGLPFDSPPPHVYNASCNPTCLSSRRLGARTSSSRPSLITTMEPYQVRSSSSCPFYLDLPGRDREMCLTIRAFNLMWSIACLSLCPMKIFDYKFFGWIVHHGYCGHPPFSCSHVDSTLRCPRGGCFSRAGCPSLCSVCFAR